MFVYVCVFWFVSLRVCVSLSACLCVCVCVCVCVSMFRSAMVACEWPVALGCVLGVFSGERGGCGTGRFHSER